MSARHILVIDNDIRVLEEIHSVFDLLHTQWQIHYTHDVLTAIHFIEEHEVEVVVADGQLPHIDGKHLLEYVRTHSASTVRIVLAQEDNDQVRTETLMLGHQYLLKPCDPAALLQAIERATLFRTQTDNPLLQQLVVSMGTLPTLPETHSQLIRTLQSSDVSMKEVSSLIAQDLAISVEVLRLVNSAYFSLRQQVSDMQQAVTLLGLDTVRALVQAVTVFSAIDNPKTQILRQELHAHVIEVSQWARKIGRDCNFERATLGNAVLAGMLHDTGKLIFSSYFAQDYFSTITLARNAKLPLYQAEQQIFGVSHAEMGAYLLGLWGFPEEILIGVRFHHQPSSFGGDNDVLGATHLADVLVHQQRRTAGSPAGLLDQDYIQRSRHHAKLQSLYENITMMAVAS